MSHKFKKLCSKAVALLLLLVLLPMQVSAAASGTHTPVEGVTVSVSGASDNSMSSGAVTVTAKGSGGLFGAGAYAKTAKITITNSGETKANISFTIVKTNVNSLTASAGTLTEGGFSHTFDAGTFVTLTLTTGKNNTENKVVLSAFNYQEVSDEATATVTYDSAKGSVSLGGSAVASGGSATVTGGTLSAVATPASGCSFLGWVNTATREILATAASTTLNVPQNMDIQAVFVNKTSDTAWFSVDGKYLVNDLTTAGSKGTQIVLANNGTLASGAYTIASGDTLLIPFDVANTVYTTKPGDDGSDTYATTSVYRKLTMAQGANITVDGAISVGGKISTNQSAPNLPTYTNGAPSGPLGHIEMAEGSSITVNKGANLYAWGYVTGSGNVTIKSGGNVYEDLQIRDWRGGNATSDMKENKQDVFPFNQYYIQNIEAPLTLEAGATETVCTAMSVTLVGVVKENAVFIGKDAGLIRLNSGSLTRTYDGSKDRITYSLDGDVGFGNLSISIRLSVIEAATINSKDYVMPIASNMTLCMESGSTVKMGQDIALLPGSIVTIAQNATCTISKGNRLYVYDGDQWGGYSSPGNTALNPVYMAPGKTYTRTAKDLVDAELVINGTLDAEAGSIYTTSGGAKICSDGTGVIHLTKGTETITYQAVQTDNKIGSWAEIPIDSARLLNGDGTYLSTATDTYTYANGVWNCTAHNYDEGVETTPATCEEDGVKTFTCFVCKGTKTGIITKLGHLTEGDNDHICEREGCDAEISTCKDNATEVEAKEATCYAEGYNPHWVCGVCGKFYSDAECTIELAEADRVIAKIEHTPAEGVTENNVAATCTADGSYDTVVYCSVEECKAEISRVTTTVKSNGHTPGAEANCTDSQTCTICGAELTAALGHTAGEAATCTTAQTCTVCEEVLAEAKGHTWNDATCTVSKTCSVCGATEGEAAGHKYEAVVTAPACEAKGYTTHTCSVCKDSYVDTYVDATGHDMKETAAAVAPTCTAAGTTAVQSCANGCGKTEGGETVDALGHDKVNHAAQAPTCTEVGWDAYETCSRCDYTTYVEKTALGHDIVIDNAVEATCTATGLTEGSHCSRCDGATVAQQTVPMADHTSGEPVVENNVAPTCTADGSYDNVVKCSVCGKELSRETVTVSTNGHTPGNAVKENEVAATCGNAGSYDNVVKCSVCGAEISRETVTVDALGHTEETVAGKAATCTETGLTDGKKCTVCGVMTVAQEEISALGHKEEVIAGKDATCTETGLTEGKKCSVCGTITVEQEEIPAKGHTPGEAAT